MIGRLFVSALFLSSAAVAFAQSSPPQLLQSTQTNKPVLLQSDAPEAPNVMNANALRTGLIAVCQRELAGAALNVRGYVRGKDVVPEAAKTYREDVASYVDFACPCAVDAAERQVGLMDTSTQGLNRIGEVFRSSLQQACSKDRFAATSKDKAG